LTIDGIVYVVDCGFVKQKEYNPSTGLDSLQVVLISRSEAQQRAGRAGRTRSGECVRLYGRDMEEEMLPFTAPEIQRTSLTAVLLTLKNLGIHDVIAFDYLSRPEDKRLLEALRMLFLFDAIDRDGRITPLGRRMAAFPLAPSLSRILLAAIDQRSPVLGDLTTIVAMLSVENLLIRPGRGDDQALADEAHQLVRAGGGADAGPGAVVWH